MPTVHKKSSAVRGRAAEPSSTTPAKSTQDRELVNDCLAGNQTAWESLFRRCHPALITVTKLLLGTAATDQNLVEEIVGRVWYALASDPHRRLDPYDPQRGSSLTSFLAGLARNEIRQHFRAERRRKSREKTASTAETAWEPLSIRQMWGLIDEFLARLTPREKQYFETNLLTFPADGVATFSEANSWQLRHRIQRKLHEFLREI